MKKLRTSPNIIDVLMTPTRERVVNTVRGDRVPPVLTKILATINMIRESETLKIV